MSFPIIEQESRANQLQPYNVHLIFESPWKENCLSRWISPIMEYHSIPIPPTSFMYRYEIFERLFVLTVDILVDTHYISGGYTDPICSFWPSTTFQRYENRTTTPLSLLCFNLSCFSFLAILVKPWFLIFPQYAPFLLYMLLFFYCHP